MSGKRKPVLLPELILQSDAILLVKKASPHAYVDEISFGDSKGPGYKANSLAYKVISILMAKPGLDIGPAIRVIPSHDLPNYKETLRQKTQPGHKILLYPYYAAETPKADTLPEFLIFVKHVGSLGRYFFTADGALESKEKSGRIKSLLKEQASQ